ncbi:uncharacterized protein PFL1_00018 [Pseudozyma flocculosa PF-1]|uniref:Thioesterase n=1 Tax=Pseudozyma flocculosa TaxID=84751 RepID=A0A5C3EUS2_9BASI|nr:uncharacterized protein PFL1_00018 [Pseudozyma flocculosa PF-1]EPQ31819.1 hypothetical protein PFL1_00018 [Pseudozyma flocculosa PF-1]SPO35286.1 uncharacterized protein PSFLO_00757 [Pseudozyma flocculosa]
MYWLLILPLSLVLGLHYKSLPFAWHIRLFWIAIKARYRTTPPLFLARTSPRISRSTPHLLLDSLPIGVDVFDDRVVEHFKVGFDDGDFLGHLSNSCYPKNLDYVRMSYAMQRLPVFARDGGWTALAAIQFKFLREIPIGKRYSVRVGVLGWDDKWFYVRSEFYTTLRSKKIDEDQETIHCEATSRHCFKYRRRTIPPWLVFATAGYSPRSSADRRVNWEKTEGVRLSLAKRSRGGKVNLLDAWSRNVGTEREEEWMRKEFWDLAGWEDRRKVATDEITLSI